MTSTFSVFIFKIFSSLFRTKDFCAAAADRRPEAGLEFGPGLRLEFGPGLGLEFGPGQGLEFGPKLGPELGRNGEVGVELGLDGAAPGFGLGLGAAALLEGYGPYSCSYNSRDRSIGDSCPSMAGGGRLWDVGVMGGGRLWDVWAMGGGPLWGILPLLTGISGRLPMFEAPERMLFAVELRICAGLNAGEGLRPFRPWVWSSPADERRALPGW
jgi:hypothetical protein